MSKIKAFLSSEAVLMLSALLAVGSMFAVPPDNWQELLPGVNIGGLGTPIASMASLISMRLYNSSENAAKGRYLIVFSAVNFALLAILLGVYIFVI